MSTLQIIRDSEIKEAWETKVLPYVEKRRESGSFERVPGQRILYERLAADEEKAVLVLVHGFTESMVKFYETAYYFLQSGYSVFLIQQRGHGKSYRSFTKDLSLVHITDYNDLIEDLHYFVENIVKPAVKEGEPLYLYGHSMGGGVSAVYLERYPDDFPKAVLNAPMLGLNSGGVPVWLMVALAKLMVLLGKGATYMPGSKPFTPEPEFETSCTTCRERYDQYLDLCVKKDYLQMSASSYVTGLQFLYLTRYATKPENCAKVKAKVLLLQAADDNMVTPEGQALFASGAPDVQLIQIPDSKHEIYRCTDKVLKEYWDRILSFLG